MPILINLVDLAIAILLVEAVVLLLAGRGARPRHGLKPTSILMIAASGIGLMIALRAALSDGSGTIILAGLTLGGIAHAADLALRLRSPRGG